MTKHRFLSTKAVNQRKCCDISKRKRPTDEDGESSLATKVLVMNQRAEINHD
jgi:hypothetical protein